MLFVRIRSALAEYEAYEQEIVLHAACAAAVQQHAMMLSVQQLSIARYIPTLPSCVHILNALYMQIGFFYCSVWLPWLQTSEETVVMISLFW